MGAGRRAGRAAGRRAARTAATAAAMALLGAAGLSGCGEAGTTADDPYGGPAGTPTASSTPSPREFAVGEEVPATVVGLLTQSAARGEVSPVAVVVDDADDLAGFVSGFEGEQLRGDVTSAVDRAEPAADEAVVAAVVDLGCDPPEEVVAVRTPKGVRVARADKPDRSLNCYVPMTTVAVLTVPASAAGPA